MAEHTPVLHILALGPPEVRLGEQPVIFPTRKTLALLIYLATEAGLQPRDQLASLLWPEATPERSYASLRNTLGHLHAALRQASGMAQTAYLWVTHQALGLNPNANINFDLQIVKRAYSRATADRSSRTLPEGSISLSLLQSAAACQRGDFLVGFSLGDAPGFDDWAALQREVWRRRLGLILDRLSEIQFARGEFSDVTETAAHWIAMDTLNEIAYRRKMRAHFAAGERGQALLTYEACHSILAAELGVEPEPDTAALAERIRTESPPVHSPNHRSVPRPDTSVAFLGNLFTGRVSENQLLIDRYKRATKGQPQLVVLRGEAGIGKTRLASKFLAWAKTQGAELLQGGAYESSSHLPFQPIVDALRLRLEHENSLQDLLDEIWLPPLSQLIPELRQRYLRKSPDPMDIPHSEEYLSQTQLYEPIVQYTLALAKRAPLVLYVDDLQWADNTTLELFLYTIRRWRANNARVLMLVSLRSEALLPIAQPQQANGPQGIYQWLTRITREVKPVHIELEPLGQHETVQMLLSILSPPAADFAQWLYDDTRGQPFYLIETLKDLLERHILRPKRQKMGQWIFAVDAEHDIGRRVRAPSTVQAVVRSRLNRLSPNAFSLLASGAVLEHQITFERLYDISNLAVDMALPALDELISARLLLEATQPGAASAYTFTNDMLRDVVYTEAGDARRRLFHSRALQVLETAQAPSATLAHHALAAGLAQETFHHSLAAGREALRISAVSESITHLELANQFVQEGSLSKIPDQAELRDLFKQLGRAYQLAGQNIKAEAIEDKRDQLG